ncbi:ring-cleaving dioxygenase [Rubrivirga sp. S365]|uniref:Ring-cleaving dioxygenase n=1 Tax=Rubrivirga litoralis TaxID=3075598 RepID=A0ABU3BPG8_9BACT|nr:MULTISPECIES: ring-cleaving dioxygenase [unclassified Rubrivirga]MDT0631163.1 ring-cleaving dioxygenase [Rubrivirga sp. F394]MDT7856694.1 ring-cleaving dioxygenase [Rubrivirga sp. S365]
MSSPVTGLHHVTAITGAAQANVDFYAGRLGLRLVKKTVNFDDPGTYHLYYADGDVRPGSVLTFFPWAGAAPGRPGPGETTATAYAVAPGAIDAWQSVFAEAGEDVGERFERFGESGLRLRAPDGLTLEMIETDGADGQWADGPVPVDQALGAFHSVTLCSRAPEATARVLTEAYGYREQGQEDGRIRFVNDTADYARYVDLSCEAVEGAGRNGSGTVHHIAFRVPDDEAELEVREVLLGMGLQPTPQIDRQYFHSVYTREPGGILFEVATDPPGFATDETEAELGRSLQLPPQYEPKRAAIEARLAPLSLPY